MSDVQGERISWIEIQDPSEVPFRGFVIVTDDGSKGRKVQALAVARGEAAQALDHRSRGAHLVRIPTADEHVALQRMRHYKIRRLP
jgi:hypothetical protein